MLYLDIHCYFIWYGFGKVVWYEKDGPASSMALLGDWHFSGLRAGIARRSGITDMVIAISKNCLMSGAGCVSSTFDMTSRKRDDMTNILKPCDVYLIGTLWRTMKFAMKTAGTL